MTYTREEIQAKYSDKQILDMARVCHDANAAYCVSVGDNSQKSWDDAEQWQRESMLAGVIFRLGNPDLEPADQHREWMRFKLEQGWKYGIVKDADKKEHPCLVPWEDLPEFQRRKDYLSRAIVNVLK